MKKLHESFEDGRVVLRTVSDFEALKKTHENDSTPKNLLAGSINIPAALETPLGDTELKDADGEVVSIADLRLVMAGTLAADAVPELKPEHMKDFCVAVAKTATYNQRHLPIWQKIVILWKFFAELFLNKNYKEEGDPYVMVAYQWYRRQTRPAPAKMRWKILWKRVKDMFIYTPQAEPIDTYGMPGFQSYRKSA